MPERQRGSALVVTLLVFAIGVALVVPMQREYTLLIKRSANRFADEQAHAYLLGGEQLAMLALREDARRDANSETPSDHLAELWAQELQGYALDEGGLLRGKLEDLQGRFNLNSLADPPEEGSRFSIAQAQFIRLLQTSETVRVSEHEAIRIAESVMDWLDDDDVPRDFGAEDDYYYSATPPYRAANRSFASVSELRAVAHVTPEIYAAVEPLLSAWGGVEININTAPAAVLRTLNGRDDYQPLSADEVKGLLELRGGSGFESVQALLRAPELADRELPAGLAKSLTVRSEVFLFTGSVDIAGRVGRLYSVLLRKGPRVKALVRSAGGL